MEGSKLWFERKWVRELGVLPKVGEQDGDRERTDWRENMAIGVKAAVPPFQGSGNGAWYRGLTPPANAVSPLRGSGVGASGRLGQRRPQGNWDLTWERHDSRRGFFSGVGGDADAMNVKLL